MPAKDDFRGKAMRYTTTVAIDAAPQRVWEVLSAVESWPTWTPTVTTARRLDEGPLRVGSRTELHQPKQPSRVWTVTELVPGEFFAWTSGPRVLRLDAGHRLRADDEGTVVTLDFAVRGALAFFARPLAGTIREFVDTEARSLKAHCEHDSGV